MNANIALGFTVTMLVGIVTLVIVLYAHADKERAKRFEREILQHKAQKQAVREGSPRLSERELYSQIMEKTGIRGEFGSAAYWGPAGEAADCEPITGLPSGTWVNATTVVDKGYVTPEEGRRLLHYGDDRTLNTAGDFTCRYCGTRQLLVDNCGKCGGPRL